MFKILVKIALCGLLSVVLILPAAAQSQGNDSVVQAINTTQWITEQYPPFNFRDPQDGTIKGISVDILMLMFQKIGVDKKPSELKILPWARSYQMAQKDSTTALFSMTYTDERRKLFKFVGPIVPSRVSLIAKKSRHLKVTSVEEMNTLRIGVTRDDIGHLLLQELGVDQKAIITKASLDNLVKMLYRDRLDAIAYAEDIIRHQSQLAGLDPAACEPIYLLKESHMGYAFHLAANQDMIDSLQTALDQLRSDGSVERIRQQYLK